MVDLNEVFQSADWKKEKHAPVIETKVNNSSVLVEVSVGKEIPHPNVPEHYISWIQLFFRPEGEKFAIEIGKTEFNSHLETVKTIPKALFSLETNKPGLLIAFSYCNIHGLWKSEQPLNP